MTRKALCALAVLALAACSGAQEQLGLTTAPPDPFLVTRHAPLEMPLDYALRPPQPGAPRPQEIRPVDAARAAALGPAPSRSGPSAGEAALLRAAGAQYADPGVRAKLATESPALAEAQKPAVQKLLGVTLGTSTEGTTEALDPVAEAQRLRKAADAEQP
ncbi:MAG: DUF3035 domain-containing protein [Alphaproteobacteria bacterium]|jgi:hypothetical protein|nr:DUF3035 domain-containing protein [Alphaproteobacteria bacterium]